MYASAMQVSGEAPAIRGQGCPVVRGTVLALRNDDPEARAGTVDAEVGQNQSRRVTVSQTRRSLFQVFIGR